jgi:SAM-dependent MidA family methyltransferase
MEIALYEPGAGYYETRAAHDFTADYITSPQLHPAFGVLICGQLEEMWRRLGRPSEFWLIEAGPGTGVFAADVLASAEDAFPRFAGTLRVALVERTGPMIAVQKQTLRPWASIVRWLDGTEATLGPGCLFANELLDAFPVHRVAMRDELLEIFVSLAGEELVELEAGPSSGELAEQIDAGGGRLREGDHAEVNRLASSWVTSMPRLLERGYVLLLDYGEPADQLYGERHPRGTLRCYWHHTMNGEPLRRVGMQDITAHVDLSAVASGAARAGLLLGGATHQQRLLARLGADAARLQIARGVAGRAALRGHEAALDLLTSPAHLGRVAALVLAKNAPVDGITGFTEGAVLPPPRTERLLETRVADPRGLAASLAR